MYKRSEKVAEAIHELVCQLLLKGIKDPRIGFVTITGVEVTDDLNMAKIYFTVHGGDEEKKATLQGLNSARGFIRKEMGRQIRMRRPPDIHFAYDESVDYGCRIENILKEINSADEGNDK